MDYAKRWCKNMNLAHFSIMLESKTKKAVILWTNGKFCRDVPETYQVCVCELLLSGETFTTESIPRLSLQSDRARSSVQLTESRRTTSQPHYLQYVQRYLALVS